jgi:hypothetical protein
MAWTIVEETSIHAQERLMLRQLVLPPLLTFVFVFLVSNLIHSL